MPLACMNAPAPDHKRGVPTVSKHKRNAPKSEMPRNHGTTALGPARPYQRPAVKLSAATGDMTAQLYKLSTQLWCIPRYE